MLLSRSAQRRAACTAVCCLGLSAPLFALQSEPVTHAWRGSSDPGAFRSTIALELTGDKSMDAAVLDGSTPVVLESPGRHDAQIALDVVAEDLCGVGRASAELQGDLVTVGPDGALLHRYSMTTGRFGATDIGGAAWVDARRVISGQIDGVGGHDVVGLNASWTTVLQLYRAGAGWVPGPSFPIVSRPNEMVLAHWDDDGELEIVMRSADALFVYGSNGVLEDMVSGGGEEGAIAALSIDGVARDCIAWAKYDPVTQSSLLSIVRQGGAVEEHDLGTLQVVALTGADFDRDGDDDLFVSSRSERVIRHYVNEPADSWSSFEASLAVGHGEFVLDTSGAAAPGNSTAPVLADFDWDNDADLFFVFEDTQQSYFFEGTLFDADASRVSITQDGGSDYFDTTLVLQYEAPPSLHPAASHLRVRVWDQSALGVDIQPGASIDQLFPLGAWPLEASLDLDAETLLEVFSIEAQIVFVTPSTQVIRRAWPAYIGAFSFDRDTYLQISEDEGTTAITIGDRFETLGREAGGFVPKNSVTPFDDEEIPSQ